VTIVAEDRWDQPHFVIPHGDLEAGQPEFRFGLSVQPIDSLTQGPLASAADIVARDGAFADSVRALAPGQFWATAGERPGTYQVTVRAAGYQPWVRSGIVVTSDGCHVKLVVVTARLQRTQ